jgi:hypothetical protein
MWNDNAHFGAYMSSESLLFGLGVLACTLIAGRRVQEADYRGLAREAPGMDGRFSAAL